MQRPSNPAGRAPHSSPSGTPGPPPVPSTSTPGEATPPRPHWPFPFVRRFRLAAPPVRLPPAAPPRAALRGPLPVRARLPTAAATSPLPAGAGAAPGRAGLGGGRRQGEHGSPSGAQGGRRRRVSCRAGAVVAGSGVTAEGRAGSGSGRWAARRRAPEAGGECRGRAGWGAAASGAPGWGSSAWRRGGSGEILLLPTGT